MDTAGLSKALADARRELQELARQQTSLNAKRTAVESMIRGIEAFLRIARQEMDDQDRLPGLLQEQREMQTAVQRDGFKLTISRTLPDRIRNLLSDAMKPMTARQILDAITADGWTTSSQDPISVVRNTLAAMAKAEPARIMKFANDDQTVGYYTPKPSEYAITPALTSGGDAQPPE